MFAKNQSFWISNNLKNKITFINKLFNLHSLDFAILNTSILNLFLTSLAVCNKAINSLIHDIADLLTDYSNTKTNNYTEK